MVDRPEKIDAVERLGIAISLLRAIHMAAADLEEPENVALQTVAQLAIDHCADAICQIEEERRHG